MMAGAGQLEFVGDEAGSTCDAEAQLLSGGFSGLHSGLDRQGCNAPTASHLGPSNRDRDKKREPRLFNRGKYCDHSASR